MSDDDLDGIDHGPPVAIPDDLDGADLPELAALANKFHDGAISHARSALECAWHAGRALIATKKLCVHGEWTFWLAANFNGSDRTARAYMQLAKRQSSADLDPEQSIDAALKAIAKRSAAPATST